MFNSTPDRASDLSMPQSKDTTSSALNCTTCQVSFGTNVLQREHMRCDWHVYNLKRKIASLPPVSAQIFNEQVTFARNSTVEKEDFKSQASCAQCRKVFHSLKAYESHILGKAHTRNATSGEEQPKDESVSAPVDALPFDETPEDSTEVGDDAENDGFISSVCLFCPVESSSMEDNMSHMQRSHGLFIPDPEHLIDMESFLGYLFTVITEFQECLYCSITKSTVEGLQHHMIDKRHCNIKFDEGSEWKLFYDYSESDPTTVSGTDAVISSAMAGMVISSEDNELRLPSGRVLTHRSQMQHHRPISHSPSRPSPSSSSSITNTESTSSTSNRTAATSASQQLTIRNSDRMGLIGVSSQQHRALRAVEKMMLKQQVRGQNAYQAGVQKGANRQKHFKPDVPGPKNG